MGKKQKSPKTSGDEAVADAPLQAEAAAEGAAPAASALAPEPVTKESEV